MIAPKPAFLASLVVIIVATSTPILAQDDGPSAFEAKVQDFVHMRFHHGVPVGYARQLGKEAVPVLIEMLGDTQHREAWPNIVYILGILEDEAAAPHLIDFLENRFTGPVDDSTFRALTLVPVSLGMIAGDRGGNIQRYLIDGLSVSEWGNRHLAWSHALLTPDERNVLMLKVSATAVGFLGTPDSREVLKNLESELAQTAGEGITKAVLPSVREALVMNSIIESEGRQILFDSALEEMIRRPRE